jgi:hypothetical protein
MKILRTYIFFRYCVYYQFAKTIKKYNTENITVFLQIQKDNKAELDMYEAKSKGEK